MHSYSAMVKLQPSTALVLRQHLAELAHSGVPVPRPKRKLAARLLEQCAHLRVMGGEPQLVRRFLYSGQLDSGITCHVCV